MHTKKLKYSKVILSALFFVSISFNVHAADISALNFNGDLIGKVIPDGSVINFDNELIGRITADGFVFNESDNLVGGIVPQGMAVSYNNTILGKVNNDGTVTSTNDNLIGKVLPNGLVVNDNYDVLGAVISQGLVYDDKGNVVGRVSGDGRFYNLSGVNSGFVTAAGYAYSYSGIDKKTTLAGKLISSKIVTTSTGKFLGSVAPDGKVIDLNKKTIGKVHANGFVYNPDNKIIGHVVEEGYAFNFDGTYLGVVSYNGEIINKGNSIAIATFGNRVVNKKGATIGFTISTAATVNKLNGEYLGRVIAGGFVVKGRNQVGLVGASGSVIDRSGKVIGTINNKGPIFDYLGNLRANASIGGKVVSLEGVDLGYIIKDEAFDYKGKRIGKILISRQNYDKNNEYLGISGINSVLENKGKVFKISPYGYVFNEGGILSGRNFPMAHIYSSTGYPLTYMATDGKTENSSLNEIGKMTSAGYLIDKDDKLLGKNIEAFYATDFTGTSLGYINTGNLLVNRQNKAYAKILPDENVVSLRGKGRQNYGKSGNAYISVSVNGDSLGNNDFVGKVNNANAIVGKIISNGYVLDNMNALYGKTMPYQGVVTEGCKYLGVVSDSGDVRNTNDAYIGMVLANGQVVNDTEEVIGYVVTPTKVMGKNGKVMGISSPLGNVINYKNQNLGCVDINGNARNAQQEIIGRTLPNVTVMSFDSKIIGYTTFNGMIADNNDVEIATLDINGGVTSKQGEQIGSLFKYTVAFDNNNVYLGRVNPDGSVVSDNGERLGRVSHNGEVISNAKKRGYALYDLYVYDNNNKTIGYIAKNGRVYSVMGDVRGTIYRGFVLDKKQNIIGRGARDYYIRDNKKQIIGELNLNGKVINIKNIEVGELDENGNIRNNEGQIIAKAELLQYYQKPVEPEETEQKIKQKKTSNKKKRSKGNKEELLDNQEDDSENIHTEKGSKNRDETSSSAVEGDEGEYEGGEGGGEGGEEESSSEIEEYIENEPLSEEEKEAAETKATQQVIGIAITPGGKYIGDVYSDNKVIDEKGRIVGRRNEKGEIIDVEGNTAGVFQEKKDEEETMAKTSAKNWWKDVAKGATISPYSTGNEITNVGPGGGVGPKGRYNPRRAAILSQMHDERRKTMQATMIPSTFKGQSFDGWQDRWDALGDMSLSTLRVKMDYLITGDKPIPAVLSRSIISMGEAPITAIVERNIYGDSGRNVIIPAGSRVIGMSTNDDDKERSDGMSGGVKLDISWNRIIRPDGITFYIARSKTGDAGGRGGGALGYVDEQLIKKYTLPIVATLATSAASYMMAATENSTGDVETSKQQAASDAREMFITQMDSIVQEIIENKKMIQPITYVPAGTRIIIYPMNDLYLKTKKDIEDNIQVKIPGSGDGDFITEHKQEGIVVGDGTSSNNGDGGAVVLGNQGTNNSNNDDNDLVSSGNNNNQQQQARRNIAIPPPSADGSDTIEYDEEKEDAGEIDLSF